MRNSVLGSMMRDYRQTRVLILFLALYLICAFVGASDAQTLKVNHTTKGNLRQEIVAALKKKKVPAHKITKIVVQGDGLMTFEDCRALVTFSPEDPREEPIKGVLPNLKSLDLRKVAFEKDAVPDTGQYNYLPGAFEKFTKLEHVFLPRSLKKIGARAFMDCRKLTTLTYGKNLREIDFEAFYNCDLFELPACSLEVYHVTGGKLREEIRFALDNSNASADWVTELVIVGEAPMTYEDCRSLVSREYTWYENHIFRSSTLSTVGILHNLRKVDLSRASFEKGVMPDAPPSPEFKPDELEENLVGVFAPPPIPGVFEKFKNLKELLLPDSLERIGTRAFYDCARLKAVGLPEGLKSVGVNAFSNCHQLRLPKLPYDDS